MHHDSNSESIHAHDGSPERLEVNERATRWRPLLLILVVGGVIVAVRMSGAAGWIDLQKITALLEPVGRVWWAPAVMAALYIGFNLLGLPGSVLTVASGVVWGWVGGGVIALFGSTLGTGIPYMLARAHAPVMGKRIRSRALWLHHLLEREGFTTLLMLRLVPSLPYSVINYAAGFAGIRPLPYFLATALGTVPGVFVTTWLASAIFNGDITVREAFVRVAIAGGILALLVLATRLLARRRARVNEAATLESPVKGSDCGSPVP
jgi:phospholipase D1/2